MTNITIVGLDRKLLFGVFTRMLKEMGLYQQFFENIINKDIQTETLLAKYSHDLNLFFSTHAPNLWVDGAFYWDDTAQGYESWSQVDEWWRNVCGKTQMYIGNYYKEYHNNPERVSLFGPQLSEKEKSTLCNYKPVQ